MATKLNKTQREVLNFVNKYGWNEVDFTQSVGPNGGEYTNGNKRRFQAAQKLVRMGLLKGEYSSSHWRSGVFGYTNCSIHEHYTQRLKLRRA